MNIRPIGVFFWGALGVPLAGLTYDLDFSLTALLWLVGGLLALAALGSARFSK